MVSLYVFELGGIRVFMIYCERTGTEFAVGIRHIYRYAHPTAYGAAVGAGVRMSAMVIDGHALYEIARGLGVVGVATVNEFLQNVLYDNAQAQNWWVQNINNQFVNLQ